MDTKEMVKNLKEEKKALETEYKAFQEETLDLAKEYLEIEGKYGTKVYKLDDCGMHYRGYNYQYSDPKLKKKEEEEQKAFLKKNKLSLKAGTWTRPTNLPEKIKALQNEISLLTRGVDEETYQKEKALKAKRQRYIKEIKRLEEELAYKKEWLANNPE